MSQRIIRLASKDDIATMMAIFAYARSFMASYGNPNQWGPNQWPHQDVIENDIENKKSYVIVEEDQIVGTFYLEIGENAEPCYIHISGEGWKNDGPYAVIHRIASKQGSHGILKEAVAFALSKANHVRIDTHKDNKVMIHLLLKMGFAYRGEIYVDHDPGNPRRAYEL